jgi:hypothetical protein
LTCDNSRCVLRGETMRRGHPPSSEILLDRRTEQIWQAFKWYLPPGTELKSVIRPPQKQLDVIVELARQHGCVLTKPVRLNDRSSWEPALQCLRNKKFDVAAPGHSQHERRLAFDLKGPSLQAIELGLLNAAADRRITLCPPRKGWSNPKIERNGCVHVEIETALLDFVPFDFA